MSTTTKEQLHRLIDALPESEHDTAARILEALSYYDVDGLSKTIETAPFDDEPETADERAAVDEARAELARGEGIPAQVLYREYGV